MGYPIGKAPTKVGEQPTPATMPVFEGTEPKDVQRWIWSFYRLDEGPALVRGGSVGGQSDMTYEVAGGFAAFPSGYYQALGVPFEYGTVATLAAPTSGTRTDYIYVTEDGAVQVGQSQPAGTALLDKRRVPANIKATTATTSMLGDVQYAPLFGAAAGTIFAQTIAGADDQIIQTDRMTLIDRTFTLRGDRIIQVDLTATYMTTSGIEGAVDNYGSAKFYLSFDGTHDKTWEFMITRVPETKVGRYSISLPSGTHTVKLERKIERIPNNGVKIAYKYGGSDRWPGTRLELTDLGQAV